MASRQMVTLLLPDFTVQGTHSFVEKGILLVGSSIHLEIRSNELTPASRPLSPQVLPCPLE